MLIDTGRIRISISLLFALLLAVSANMGEGRIYFMSILFSFIHEGVHLFFLFRAGVKKAEMRLSAGGIKIICPETVGISYKKTIIICISAPVMNLIAGVVFYILYLFSDALIFQEAAFINMLLGGSNLLPLGFLDGGRGLNAILCRYLSAEKAYFICDILSVISLVITGAVFFISLVMQKYRLFLLVFFVYCASGYISSKTEASVS